LLKLKEAGIAEVLVVTGREHMGDVMELLGSGSDLGLELTYRVQDRAGGIAEALGLAEGFARGGPVCVILGDNVFEDDLAPHVARYAESEGVAGAMLLLKEVTDPERFGVAELADDGKRIAAIVEKPARPRSRLAVTGIYFYDAQVYEIIRRLVPSARGELEITDVNNAYVERGQMRFEILAGGWTDAGTFPSFARANRLAEGLAAGADGQTAT